MKNSLRTLLLTTAGIVLIGLAASTGLAAGLLKPVNGGDADAVQMKSHHVNVTLNNGFARTEVDQIFINTGDRDLEATYTFPVPRQASLSEVSLWIDGQEVVGEVLEAAKARQTYEDQKARGNETALAEKDDYKAFNLKVYPVRAGGETRVRLVYYQPVEIDLNVGRYVYPLEEGGVDENRIAFWSVDDTVRESFSFHLTLKSAFPVKDLRMPGYDTEAVITRSADAADDDGEAGPGIGEVYDVALDFPEGSGSLSRDLVVYYRLADDVPARVELIPYRPNPETSGTFMLVVTPGASLAPIAEGTDWTFVLDVSGSMRGHKIATLGEGVVQVIEKMSPTDRFRVVTFNNSARDLTGGYLPATPENVRGVLAQVKSIGAGGGTALHAGLSLGYSALDADRTTGIILVTDGVANVGPHQHADLLRLQRRHDVRLFTFVIGNSANRPLLNRLARDSGGFAMNISTSDDIIGRIIQAKAKVLNECLYGATLSVRGESVRDLTPSTIGNVYMGQQLVLFGRYDTPGEVEITLSGRISGESKTWTTRTTLPAVDDRNPEIERLWALSAISEITEAIRENGETPALRDAVVALGTGYSLVTDYTSMVVLRETEMESIGINRRNADRTARERAAQATRESAPVQSYRVDSGPAAVNETADRAETTDPTAETPKRASRGGMFGGTSAPSIGGGPVGPLFVAVAYWIRRRKTRR